MIRVDVSGENHAVLMSWKLNRGGNTLSSLVTIAFVIARNRIKIRTVHSVFTPWCQIYEITSKTGDGKQIL